jgi:hypothetical protein
MELDIPAYRLLNQRLSQDKFNTVVEVVRHLGAVQAQDYAGAKWAIGLRTDGVTDADVERAFSEGAFLRTHVLRPTWHFVAPEDIRWMLALTAPRVRALIAYMDRQLGLDNETLNKSKVLLRKTLQGGKQLTRPDLQPVFEKALLPARGQQLGQILMHAELDGLVCSGPRRGKRFTYALLEERVPPASEWTREESLAELVKRYFRTRGPATLQDFSWWSGLTLSDARKGMEMVKQQFVNTTVSNQTYWFAETELPPKKKYPPAYLLPNYDEYFIGFKDRSAIGEIARQVGIRKDDPALIAHILILDGQLIGGWRRTLYQDSVHVETSPITRLSRSEEQAVREAAKRYGEFLNLPVIYTQKESGTDRRNSRSF